MFNITGVLKVKNAEQQVSEKFKKREFVLTENSSQYPQHVSFQLTQDKCSLLDNYKVGDTMKVFFNLRGREWTNPQGEVKYFNSLEAWKIEGNTGSNRGQEDVPVADTFKVDDSDNDLPF
jgi:hypothetical protein